MKQNKVLIVGTMPSTVGVGGVTIHVKRLCQQLDSSRYSYDFCDYKQVAFLSLLNLISNYKVVHMHLSNPIIRLFLIGYCRLVGTKVVFTLHGNYGQFLGVKNKIVDLSIKIANIPIMINKMSYDRAKKINRNCKLLTSFIPPKLSDCFLPQNIECIVRNEKASGKIIVVSNASKYVLSDRGEEVYGISFLVDYFKNRSKYFLCVSDPSGEYNEYFSGKQYSNILFITENHSFFSLLQLSDIMVRPTSTDGDAISVREGLYLNKKVIATDRVNRPIGVDLFKYNDAVSFENVLNSSNIGKPNMECEDFFEKILDIYNNLLNQN